MTLKHLKLIADHIALWHPEIKAYPMYIPAESRDALVAQMRVEKPHSMDYEVSWYGDGMAHIEVGGIMFLVKSLVSLGGGPYFKNLRLWDGEKMIDLTPDAG